MKRALNTVYGAVVQGAVLVGMVGALPLGCNSTSGEATTSFGPPRIGEPWDPSRLPSRNAEKGVVEGGSAGASTGVTSEDGGGLLSMDAGGAVPPFSTADGGPVASDGASEQVGTDAADPTDGAEACIEGSACPVDDPCRVGALVCAPGGPRCEPGGNVANGKACQNGNVCLEGQCVPCAYGRGCLPDACHWGMIACVTGRPTCERVGRRNPAPAECTPLPDGGYGLFEGGCSSEGKDGGRCETPGEVDAGDSFLFSGHSAMPRLAERPDYSGLFPYNVHINDGGSLGGPVAPGSIVKVTMDAYHSDPLCGCPNCGIHIWAGFVGYPSSSCVQFVNGCPNPGDVIQGATFYLRAPDEPGTYYLSTTQDSADCNARFVSTDPAHFFGAVDVR